MKLSIKALLPLAILLVGSVNCSTSNAPADLASLKTAVEYSMNFEESLVTALEHPSVMIKQMDSNKNFSFVEWVKYLHNDDETAKADREKTISNDAAYKFYYLDLDSGETAALKTYLDDNPNVSNLEGLKGNLKDKIVEQFGKKKEYLKAILRELPIIKDYMVDNDIIADEFTKMIKSHIDEFIAGALIFDYKRFSFSSLHPAIEGIKGAIKVPRKAKHGAEAVVIALDSKNYDIALKEPKLDQIYIKRKKSDGPKKEKTENEKKAEEEANQKRKREINLITVALESANRSTSNPNYLFYTLIGSMLLMITLISHNAITAKPSEDEEGESDEECGESN